MTPVATRQPYNYLFAMFHAPVMLCVQAIWLLTYPNNVHTMFAYEVDTQNPQLQLPVRYLALGTDRWLHNFVEVYTLCTYEDAVYCNCVVRMCVRCPCVLTCRSVFGGQTVEITGSGFGTDASAVDVSFGHSVCSVSGATDTMITCTTESAAAVHYVNNSGLVPQLTYLQS